MQNMQNIDLFSGILIVLIVLYAAYRAVPLFVSGKWKEYAPALPHRIVLVLIFLYASFATLYNQIVMASIPSNIGISALFLGVLVFLAWILLGFAFLEGVVRLQRHFVRTDDIRVDIHGVDGVDTFRFWLKIFFIIMLGYTFWMIACFPANMSSDSADSWKQAIGEWHLYDWHPVMHALLIRFSALFVQSPFVMVLGQTVVQACIWATAAVFLFKLGIGAPLIYGMAVFVALSPNNGVMTMTLWKDVVFAVSVLGLSVSLARVAISSRFSIWQAILLVIALYFTALTRHNGIVPAIITTIVLSLFYLKKQWKLLPVFALVLVFSTKIIYKEIGVPPLSGAYKYPILHAIGAVFYNHGNMADDKKRILTEIIPEEKWIGDFNPFIHDPYIWPKEDPAVRLATRDMSFKRNVRLYLSMVKRNPLIVIKHHIDVSSLNWIVFRGGDPRYYTARYCFGIDDLVDFQPHESAVREAAVNILAATAALILFDAFFWKTGIFIIIFFLLLYFAWVHNTFRLNIVLLPVLVNFIVMLPITPAQDYRYTYQVFLVFPFVLLYYLASLSRNKKAE